MKSKRYRKKHRYNMARIFVVTALLLVFLGFIITRRNRNAGERTGGQDQKISREDDREQEKVMKKILADETRYP